MKREHSSRKLRELTMGPLHSSHKILNNQGPVSMSLLNRILKMDDKLHLFEIDPTPQEYPADHQHDS